MTRSLRSMLFALTCIAAATPALANDPCEAHANLEAELLGDIYVVRVYMTGYSNITGFAYAFGYKNFGLYPDFSAAEQVMLNPTDAMRTAAELMTKRSCNVLKSRMQCDEIILQNAPPRPGRYNVFAPGTEITIACQDGQAGPR